MVASGSDGTSCVVFVGGLRLTVVSIVLDLQLCIREFFDQTFSVTVERCKKLRPILIPNVTS